MLLWLDALFLSLVSYHDNQKVIPLTLTNVAVSKQSGDPHSHLPFWLVCSACRAVLCNAVMLLTKNSHRDLLLVGIFLVERRRSRSRSCVQQPFVRSGRHPCLAWSCKLVLPPPSRSEVAHKQTSLAFDMMWWMTCLFLDVWVQFTCATVVFQMKPGCIKVCLEALLIVCVC